jgi:hypothetical protein
VTDQTDRLKAAVLAEIDWIIEHCPDHGCVEPETDVCHCEIAERLRRMAAEVGPADTVGQDDGEDPARIDRMRPEFTEHSSIEAIDAQLRRAQSQERRWHLRAEWLISLRERRVAQKERGEWPAAAQQPKGA